VVAPPITVTGDLDQPPERVYAFLADLRNHWRLSRRFAELEHVDGDGGGGRVRIHGPLGLSRLARTRVVEVDEPHEVRGRADVGRGTVGTVRWLIEPRDGGSRVTLAAEVDRVSLLDRAILALGGRAILRRGFAEAIEQLGREA
jgi:uncharacterized protein YndB with AHSA1/START domain